MPQSGIPGREVDPTGHPLNKQWIRNMPIHPAVIILVSRFNWAMPCQVVPATGAPAPDGRRTVIYDRDSTRRAT